MSREPNHPLLIKIEALLEQARNELRTNTRLNLGLAAFALLLFVAFPMVMLWLLATTVVFAFVKGFLLLLEMISDK